MRSGDAQPAANRVPTSVWLVAATAFLAPYIGGNLNVEASTLGPGLQRLVSSIFDGVDTPGVANLLIAAGALVSIVVLAMRRRVLQLPNSRVAAALFVLIGVITTSVIVSNFKSVSVGAWSHWIAYALVFFAAVAATGRVRGPEFVVGAFVAGCTLSAALAIREWGQRRSIDPTWRVFAVWNNPNALAGILVIGLIVGLAMLIASDRLVSLCFGIASVAIGFALFLTQSRGGLLAATIGVAALFVAAVVNRDWPRVRTVGRFAAAFGAIIALVVVVTAGGRSGRSAPGSRVLGSTSATSQSNAFRENLWRGAAKSVLLHPVGTGIGTYSFYSAESGLTTETQLTHNSPLQLAVEASVLAPLSLIALVVMWCMAVLRGKRPEPKAAALRTGIVCAILAAGVDGMFESNLYYFGTGVAVFVLMGIGLQLAADAVAPEYAPPVMRRSLALGSIIVLALFGVYGYREVIKGNIRYDRAAGATPNYAALRAIADGDGEAHYLLGFDPGLTNDARIAEFKQAADLEPSVKHLRLLADAYAHSGHPGPATSVFREALALDPNNLETLNRLLEYDRANQKPEDAVATAKRLVDIESKPCFTVRALSEIVPLQTAEARVFLASQTADRRAAADELAGAAKLYVQYAKSTVPYLRKEWNDLPTDIPIAGESQTGMIDKLQRGTSIATSAATAYANIGLSLQASDAREMASTIQLALDDFNRALAGAR
ncbi:MAG: O-antigen ligase family protein [Fimbriimonadaceae bacterium]